MSRVQMNAEQYRLLLHGRGSPRADTGTPGEASTAKPVVKRSRKRKQDLPENQVAQQIVDFLRAKGWTVTRQQSGLFSRPGGTARITVGEVGMADWRAERPAFLDPDYVGRPSRYHELFYFEVKAANVKPRSEQIAWLESRRRTGTEARWFDSFQGGGNSTFLLWYKSRFGAT